MASLIPLALQLILLMGLVDVIYHPLTYLLQLPQGTLDQLYALTAELNPAVNVSASNIQIRVMEAVRNTEWLPQFTTLQITVADGTWEELLQSIAALNTSFLGIDLCAIPSESLTTLWFIPLIAGFAAWLLCYSQNKANVLQSEQGAINKYGTMALSVGISLYLGFFVPVGLALYWTASNLFAILQLLLLNAIIDPKKYVDYDALEDSRKKLAELQKVGTSYTKEEAREYARREKADYKRFFSVVNKHVVFYSERNGFYKYFEAIIKELLDRTNLSIHYITSDPKDDIFRLAEKEPRIRPYYIGERKLITLFMKMDAQMVIMTMSDLENYHYKRSYVRKDIEYVYVFHYPLSTHMVLHTGALDHYDTILCVGDFQFAEIRKQEELYHLPAKNLVACGYGQLEKLATAYHQMEHAERKQPKILVAPSWQKDNILDSCIDPLLHELLGQGFEVVVRPHPEYVKRYGARMDEIVRRYADYTGDDLRFELDFTSNTSLFDSDVVISDWSGTAYEFSFVTLKPCVFVDTPPKINNPDYVKLGIEPLEFTLRDQAGIRISPADFSGLADKLRELILHADDYQTRLLSLRDQTIANFGHSGEIAERYIVDSLKKHASQAKDQDNH